MHGYWGIFCPEVAYLSSVSIESWSTRTKWLNLVVIHKEYVCVWYLGIRSTNFTHPVSRPSYVMPGVVTNSIKNGFSCRTSNPSWISIQRKILWFLMYLSIPDTRVYWVKFWVFLKFFSGSWSRIGAPIQLKPQYRHISNILPLGGDATYVTRYIGHDIEINK